LVDLVSLRKFWQPALKVLSGAGIAQIVPILSNIFLAVAIGVAQFGYFSLWLGMVYLGAVISTLRLENALFIEAQGAARERSLVTVVQIVFLTALVAALVLGALAVIWQEVLPEISGRLLSTLIPAAALLGLNASAQAFVVSNGAYDLVNRFRILQALAVALTQCILVLQTPTAMSMALGFLLGQAVCLVYVVRQLKSSILGKAGYDSPVHFIRRHWRFPVFSLPADGLSSFGALLPVALIGSQYGAASAGQVALTIRVLAAPAGLLGKAIQDVFKREAVLERERRGSCERLYFTILLGAFPVLVLFVATLHYLGPAGFLFLFGDEWRQAGEMSKSLAPVFALSLVASPLSYIVYLVNRQYIDLVWQAALVGLVWYSLTQFPGLDKSIHAFALTYVSMYVVYLYISFRLCSADVDASFVK
jgi:O-antigen/teichoic acid export membrane protein